MIRRTLRWATAGTGNAFLAVFMVAAVIRLAMLPLTPLDPAFPIRNENGAVAVELNRTGHYANPYALPSGPTAHPLPVYTGVMALLFHWFGVSVAAEQARYWLHVVTYSTMYAMLPWLGVQLGASLRAGLAGGFAGALMPVFPLTIGLGEEVASIALGAGMVAMLRRWRDGRAGIWASLWLGVGWGAACHLAPALLMVLLAAAAYEVWRYRRGLQVLVLLGGTGLACAPWTMRNFWVFREWFFLRSNFGLELRMGNHDGAVADMDRMYRYSPARHPRTMTTEAEKVRELGEMEYMRSARREALDWIGTHRSEFARLTAARVGHFWFGPPQQGSRLVGNSLLTLLAMLGAWRLFRRLGAAQRAAWVIPLAAYPLVYYLVPYTARYRLPVDCFLLVLAGVAAEEWTARRMRSEADCTRL